MIEYPYMPRVTTSEKDPTPKVAPRKRVARPRSDSTEGAPVRPRRTTKAAPVAVEPEVPSTPVRRAPTTVSRQPSQRSGGRKKPSVGFITLIVFCVVLVGAGVAIGLSDQGQIDVTAVVTERNERINRGDVREGESSELSAVAPQTINRLTPATTTVPTPVVPEEVVAPESATSSESIEDADQSTEETATTTEEVEAPLDTAEPPVDVDVVE